MCLFCTTAINVMSCCSLRVCSFKTDRNEYSLVCWRPHCSTQKSAGTSWCWRPGFCHMSLCHPGLQIEETQVYLTGRSLDEHFIYCNFKQALSLFLSGSTSEGMVKFLVMGKRKVRGFLTSSRDDREVQRTNLIPNLNMTKNRSFINFMISTILLQ